MHGSVTFQNYVNMTWTLQRTTGFDLLTLPRPSADFDLECLPPYSCVSISSTSDTDPSEPRESRRRR